MAVRGRAVVRGNGVDRALQWGWYWVANVLVIPIVLTGLALLFVPGPHSNALVAVPIAVGVMLQLTSLVRYHRTLAAHRRIGPALEPATRAYVEGRFEDAQAAYRAIVAKETGVVALYARYGLGRVLLRRGKLEEAASALHAVASAPDAGPDLRVSAGLATTAALVLDGALDRAEKMLEWSEAMLPGSVQPVSQRAELGRVRALLLARRGSLHEAAALLASLERDHEQTLTLPELRRVWLLRAFLAATTTSPREAGTSERWLSLLRSTGGPEGLSHLATKWPELAAYLAANALA